MHGGELGGYAYGMWPVVVFNILIFLFFAIGFIKPIHHKTDNSDENNGKI